MKKLLFVALLILSTTAIFAQNGEETPYVEVSGRAKVKVLPDKAKIEITLRESDSKGKYSIEKLDKHLASALKNAGVDITKQLSLYRQYISKDKKKKGYQYKTYMLVVSNAAEVQTVMDELVEEEIYGSRLVKVWCEKTKEIADSLRTVAVQSALYDAKSLAGALGQSVGDAIRISYYPSNDAAVSRPMMMKSMALNTVESSDASMPNVEFEEVEIEENVSIRFLLKGKIENR